MDLLIVDDEPILRQKLEIILQSSNLNITQISMAENAFQAMEIVETDNPDIILSDIRMPQKSGIELAEEVHLKHPQTPVILITGYSDFEYTQAAIKNHVFDYIMKPVEPQKVISSIAQAQKQIELYQKHERMYSLFQEYFNKNYETLKSQYLESLLFQNTLQSNLNEQNGLFNIELKNYRVAAVKCNLILDQNNIKGDYYSTHIIEKQIKERIKDAATYIWGNTLFFIWKIETDDDFEDNLHLVSFIKALHYFLKDNWLINIFVGISKASNTLSDMQNLRRQAVECLAHSSQNESDTLLFYEDIISSDQILWTMEDDLPLLMTYIKSGDQKNSLVTLRTIIQRVSGKPDEYTLASYRLIISNITFLLHELKIEESIIVELCDPINKNIAQSIPQIPAILEGWIKKVCKTVIENYQAGNNIIVGKIRDYISCNYSQNIGLSEASRFVGRNPSYVSRLIKQYTNKSFTHLLTEKRIGEAKKLLQNTDMKVNTIAEKTGYANARYFNRVFKSMVHMSANDFRNFTADFHD